LVSKVVLAKEEQIRTRKKEKNPNSAFPFSVGRGEVSQEARTKVAMRVLSVKN